MALSGVEFEHAKAMKKWLLSEFDKQYTQSKSMALELDVEPSEISRATNGALDIITQLCVKSGVRMVSDRRIDALEFLLADKLSEGLD